MSSPWGSVAGLERIRRHSVTDSPNAPHTPVSSPLYKPFESKCKQILQKDPEFVCPRTVYHLADSSEVVKSFCTLHRLCFYPVQTTAGTIRCRNLRKSVGSLYCVDHTAAEQQCKDLITKYKTVDCAGVAKCYQTDSPDDVWRKKKKIVDCYKSRERHQEACLYPKVVSLGHEGYFEKLRSWLSHCDSYQGIPSPTQIGPEEPDEAYGSAPDEDEEEYFLAPETTGGGKRKRRTQRRRRSLMKKRSRKKSRSRRKSKSRKSKQRK